MSEHDPAAPSEPLQPEAHAAAAALTNGTPPPGGHPPAATPELPLDIDKALAFLEACASCHPRVTYGLGAKAPSDASQPGNPCPPGFLHIDCSGFVRAAIRRSTQPPFTAFPDGSVVQHEWVKAHGFEKSSVDDGALSDGKLRIAFLPPSAVASHIGHVVLLYDGKTLESHGGVGPDRRVWANLPWRLHTEVFELA
ncbi:MAG TPA: hypothetical protein VHS81_06460 [Caulobacteraceae bacterium]|nr:hypothetical protein [Caulobacteraceae bacterium]